MAFQIASPLLDACVLSLLEHEDAYGYSLTQGIQKVIDVSDSTMYPVLRRLQKENYLETYDRPFQGRNRRYYKLTELGAQKLAVYRIEWNMYKMQVEKLLQIIPEEVSAIKVDESVSEIAVKEDDEEEEKMYENE